MTKTDLEKLFQFWENSARRDLAASHTLGRTKYYSQALFFLHLSLEKKIKALIVKQTKNHPPHTHNLVFLLGKTDVEVDNVTLDALQSITAFNIEGRYSNEKKDFHKIATREFYLKWKKIALSIHNQLDRLF